MLIFFRLPALPVCTLKEFGPFSGNRGTYHSLTSYIYINYIINRVIHTLCYSFSYQDDEGRGQVGVFIAGTPLTPALNYFEVEILDTGLLGAIGMNLLQLSRQKYMQVVR